jgi:hypothetical protein
VKTCGYCGRENEDGASACAGCGSELEQTPTVPPKPQLKARRRWPDLRLRYFGYPALLVLLYFLSLGPAVYFFGKMTTTTAAGAAGGPGMTTSVTVEFSSWLAIIYYPAFSVYGSQWGDSTYGRYVLWWMERRQGKH